MPKLTDTQLVILSAAAQRDDRSALPLPKSLKLAPGPTGSVLKRLIGKALLEEVPARPGLPIWREEGDQRRSLVITDEGFKALGIDEERPDSLAATPKSARKSKPAKQKSPSKTDHKPTAPRSGSKLDQMLSLLGAKEGATIAQMTTATGWQAHTVRAAMTGLRKRGYRIERRKSPKGDTVYLRVGA